MSTKSKQPTAAGKPAKTEKVPSAIPLRTTPAVTGNKPATKVKTLSGFSTDDAFMTVKKSEQKPELKPAEEHVHVPTRSSDLWGDG